MYKILLTNEVYDSSVSAVEVVERKGIGHPDSVADIIAEVMSNTYSKYSLENFGVILNHWFDKVLISGGEAILFPGGSIVIRKPKVYLFGKITNVTDFNFPLEELFRGVVNETFKRIFKIDDSLCPDIFIDVNSGVGAEHDKNFYTFKNNRHLQPLPLLSNDTVFCCGYYNYSKLESFVVDLENYVNSELFKQAFPSTGYDVKVLAIRNNDDIKLTICIPFIASKISSWSDYDLLKKKIETDLYKFCKPYLWNSLIIFLNSKDLQGKGYLTVYGSALDKGDYGAVGRGNRYSGFISSNRGETQEAYHGKNPVLHTGKLYTIMAHKISKKIFNLNKVPNKVLLTINNGDKINSPETIWVNSDKITDQEEQIKKIIDNEIANLSSLTLEIINKDPISEFKYRL